MYAQKWGMLTSWMLLRCFFHVGFFGLGSTKNSDTPSTRAWAMNSWADVSEVSVKAPAGSHDSHP